MIRLPKIPKLDIPGGKKGRGPARPKISTAQIREYERCHPRHGVAGFLHFCRKYVKIIEARTKEEIAFDPFPGQLRVIDPLVKGEWLLLLKGRQLGFTSLMAAYTTWRVIFSTVFRAVCINQELQYAEDFIVRVKWIHDHLPAWMQHTITVDNKKRLEMNAGGCTREIRSLVGSDRAARSITADLVMFDEASRVPMFKESLGACQPAIESAGGQIIVYTTSKGPVDDFYELWVETYGDHGELLDANMTGPTGFKVVFVHWSERPGRDQAWYLEQKERLDRLGPCMVKQEYPDTPEEAFEFAAGRVFPLFTRDRCVGDVLIDDHTPRYRGIDWGETKSAYVVLWVAHIAGPPGLLISPGCPNAIREMIGYRWDEDRPGQPVKHDDHAPDALRYIVTTFDLTGLVYVYREIYRMDSLAKGWNPLTEIAEIHAASGWVKASETDKRHYRPGRRAERYEGTVADRSWGKAIALFSEQQIPCIGQKKIRRPGPKGERGVDLDLNERLEGLRMVSALIDGSEEIEKRIQVTRAGEALRVYREHERARRGTPHTVGLQERRIHEVAKDLLKRRRRAGL